jgi:hypothetical protein
MAAKNRVWRKPGGVHRKAVRLVCEQTMVGGAGYCNFWFSRLRREYDAPA